MTLTPQLAQQCLEALEPFTKFNSSEPTITVPVWSADVTRARAASAALREALASGEGDGWMPIESAPPLRPRCYLVASSTGQVAPHIDGVIHNTVGTAWDWNYGESITHWRPLPAPPARAAMKGNGK